MDTHKKKMAMDLDCTTVRTPLLKWELVYLLKVTGLGRGQLVLTL